MNEVAEYEQTLLPVWVDLTSLDKLQTIERGYIVTTHVW